MKNSMRWSITVLTLSSLGWNAYGAGANKVPGDALGLPSGAAPLAPSARSVDPAPPLGLTIGVPAIAPVKGSAYDVFGLPPGAVHLVPAAQGVAAPGPARGADPSGGAEVVGPAAGKIAFLNKGSAYDVFGLPPGAVHLVPAAQGVVAPGPARVADPSGGAEVVGPAAGKITFLNEEGPFYQVLYTPAGVAQALNGSIFDGSSNPGAAERRDYGGRRPVHVLFGGGHNSTFDRPWISEFARNAVEAARQEIPGLELLVVDLPGHLPPADATHHGLEADLAETDSNENLAAIADKILTWAEEHNAVIVGANAVLNPFILHPSILQEKARDSGHNPHILVNPREAVEAARDKSKGREVVARYFPELVPQDQVIEYSEDLIGRFKDAAQARASALGLPTDDPSRAQRLGDSARRHQLLVEEAADLAVKKFHEMAELNPGSRFVLKPQRSSGKVGIRLGIATAEDARREFLSIQHELTAFWDEHPEDRAMHAVQEVPRIVIERQIEADGEYDVEMVLARLASGALHVVAFVVGNTPLAHGTEYGMTFPAMLSSALEKSLIERALKAVLARWFPAIPFGNDHVEKMLENGVNPMLVEDNGPRPIGGSLMIPLILDWAGFNLVEQGIRAALGLPLQAPQRPPVKSVVVRKIMPGFSGKLVDAAIPEAVRAMPGLTQVVLTPLGKEVHDPRAGMHAFSGLGYVVGQAPAGKQEEAIATVVGAMSRMTFRIETAEGIRVQNGDAHQGEEKRFPRPR